MSRATVEEAEGRPLLRRYAWLIVTVTVTIVVAITIVVLSPSTYSSSSSVVVEPAPTPKNALPPNMEIERYIVFSGEVDSRAAHRHGLPPYAASSAEEGLSVSVPSDTNILNISYSADSPQEALAGAMAFTRAYITFRNSTGARVAHVITPPMLPTEPTGTDWNPFD